MSRRYVAVVRKVPPDFALALVDVWIGTAFVLQDEARTAHVGIYDIALRLIPSMHVWGAMFLIIGLSLLYVVWHDHHHQERRDAGLVGSAISWVQIGGPALYAAWAVMALISAAFNNHASFAASGIYAFLAFRHSFAPAEPASDRDDAGTPWSGSQH